MGKEVYVTSGTEVLSKGTDQQMQYKKVTAIV